MLVTYFLLCFTLHLASSALQPDNVNDGDYDDLEGNPASLCTRICKDGEPPKICYYQFVVENYVTLGGACGNCSTVQEDCSNPQCVPADGFERPIISINRRLPGPSIQVCKGDTIVVDVYNQIKGGATTIHWHGFPQRDSPWMDGVPMVTQCPIAEGQTFRYNFLAADAGTFWYHSHSGLQKADGLIGGIVVRQPDSQEPSRQLYDLDLPSHLVVVEDWKHSTTVDNNPGLIQRGIVEDAGGTFYLINGRGVDLMNTSKPLSSQVPFSVFRVEEGKRYRFRIVGAGSSSCLSRFSIEGHKLLLIGIDKNPIQPITVESILIASGERYDVVIEASQPVNSYLIEVVGQTPCLNSTRQVAILKYEGSTLPTAVSGQSSNVTGVTVNPLVSSCSSATLSSEVCISQLSSVNQTPSNVLKTEPDMRVVLNFGFSVPNNTQLYDTETFQDYFFPVDMQLPLVGLVNNISFKFAPSPLLTQLEDVPPSSFCDSCPSPDPGLTYCRCTHVIKLPLNSVVEFLMIDTHDTEDNKLTHPFHIHGGDFYVLQQGLMGNASLQDILTSLSQRDDIRDFLPMKDTVIVPKGGYTVTRILADNPGFWLFHCHINFHLAKGMTLVFQVGEPSDMLPPPKNFTKCSSFVPEVTDLLL